MENLGCIVLEHVSFGRQRHFSPLPVEEDGPYLLLQFGNVLAHGGLGDAQVLGRPGEASLGGCHHEDTQSEIIQHNKDSL